MAVFVVSGIRTDGSLPRRDRIFGVYSKERQARETSHVLNMRGDFDTDVEAFDLDVTEWPL